MFAGFAVLTRLGIKISTKEVGYAKRETTCDWVESGKSDDWSSIKI